MRAYCCFCCDTPSARQYPAFKAADLQLDAVRHLQWPRRRVCAVGAGDLSTLGTAVPHHDTSNSTSAASVGINSVPGVMFHASPEQGSWDLLQLVPSLLRYQRLYTAPNR